MARALDSSVCKHDKFILAYQYKHCEVMVENTVYGLHSERTPLLASFSSSMLSEVPNTFVRESLQKGVSV